MLSYGLLACLVSDENRIQTTEPVTIEIQRPKFPRFPTMCKLTILILLSYYEINILSLYLIHSGSKHILSGVFYLIETIIQPLKLQLIN